MANAQWTQEQLDKAYNYIEGKVVAEADPTVDRIEEIRSIVQEAWQRLNGDYKENYVDTIKAAFNKADGTNFTVSFTAEEIQAVALS